MIWKGLILALLLWWVWRRVLNALMPGRRHRSQSSKHGQTRNNSNDKPHKDLTRQEISDADYEEIP